MENGKIGKTAEAIRGRLLKRFEGHRIANENTDLVVEGYPRSANTFCVEFIDQMMKREGASFRIAHHLHTAEHLALAVELDIPCLALIREPVSAITSFCLYMDYEPSRATSLYVQFYEKLFDVDEDAVIADFSVVHADMNVIISSLNDKYRLNIPLSEHLEADAEKALDSIAERSKKTHGSDKYTQKAGVPLEARGEMKRRVQPEVEDYLRNNDAAIALYGSIRKLDNYIGK